MKRIQRKEAAEDAVLSWTSVCYDIAEILVVSLVCVVVFFTMLFRIVGVKGDSMKDTLYGGDRLILCPILTSPERGDIVVVNRYTDEPLIKRVIGVAGDRIEIDPDLLRVRLNGELLEESYVQFPSVPYDMTGEITVPEGTVFVMGDHRDNSHDSRWDDIGPVPVEDIIGHAVLRLWPFTKL